MATSRKKTTAKRAETYKHEEEAVSEVWFLMDFSLLFHQ
jgi:hypothetical protein